MHIVTVILIFLTYNHNFTSKIEIVPCKDRTLILCLHIITNVCAMHVYVYLLLFTDDIILLSRSNKRDEEDGTGSVGSDDQTAM